MRFAVRGEHAVVRYQEVGKQVSQLQIKILAGKDSLGRAAADQAATSIRRTIRQRGIARIVAATGASQFEFLDALTAASDIDWSCVEVFHLDEYIGLPITHPASFRKYLLERFLSKVRPLKAAYLVNGETDPKKECDRLGDLISKYPIDVALAGIGENGHLAFNDPPADFETEQPYIIVELDEACRKQQMGEGWFKSVEDVPHRAISMSIKQILKSKNIICSVPDKRKAIAVKNCLEQPVNNLYPASILQVHENCICYLDKDSAALLNI